MWKRGQQKIVKVGEMTLGHVIEGGWAKAEKGTRNLGRKSGSPTQQKNCQSRKSCGRGGSEQKLKKGTRNLGRQSGSPTQQKNCQSRKSCGRGGSEQKLVNQKWKIKSVVLILKLKIETDLARLPRISRPDSGMKANWLNQSIRHRLETDLEGWIIENPWKLMSGGPKRWVDHSKNSSDRAGTLIWLSVPGSL